MDALTAPPRDDGEGLAWTRHHAWVRWHELRLDADRLIDERPDIYSLFVELSLKARRSGREHWGAAQVLGIVRWDFEVEGDKEFKVPQQVAAFFARRVMREYPELDGFYRIRHQKSLERPALKDPPEDYQSILDRWRKEDTGEEAPF